MKEPDLRWEVQDLKYALLALLWASWCALHSIMIARRLTSYLYARFGDRYRYYRAFFNIIAILTLVPVLIYSHTLRDAAIFAWSGVWRPVQAVLALSAIALFYAGSRHYDLKQFLGIRQVSEHETAKGLTETGRLDKSGILGVMRHPWYTAAIIIIWVRPLDAAALVTNFVLTGYLIIGTFLEERKLVAEFGQEYRDYQKAVPMFVPGCKGERGKYKV